MPFITVLITSLLSQGVLTALLTRLAVLIGVTTLTYTGLSTFATSMLSDINAQAGGVSGYALAFLQLTGLAQGANLMVSAIMGRVALTAVTGGGLVKRLAFSPQAGLSIFA